MLGMGFARMLCTKCVAVMSNEHPGHSETKVLRNVKEKDGKTTKKEVQISAITIVS